MFYTGTTCDDDYDGCLDNPCTVGKCIDVPAASYDPDNGIKHECNTTDCPVGFERKYIEEIQEADCTGTCCYHRLRAYLTSLGVAARLMFYFSFFENNIECFYFAILILLIN